MLNLRLFILLGLCALAGAAGLLFAPLLTAAKIALWAILSLLALDLLMGWIVSRRIRASRHCPEHMSLGQPNPVETTITLPGPAVLRQLWCITCQDVPPRTFAVSGSPARQGVGMLTYNVVPSCRGRHEFGVVRCYATSILGLCNVFRFIDAPTTVKVYPTFRHLENLETQAMLQHARLGMKRQRRAGNSTDFDQIRPYATGDDVRTINWRATARVASLMVNTYTDERSQPIIPILCAGPSMLISHDGTSLLDRAASAAVALAASAVRHYDQAGLITATHQGVDAFMPPERGNGTVAKVLERTYAFGLPPTESERPLIEDPDVDIDGIDPEQLAEIRHRMEACEADTDYEALATYALQHLKRRSLLVLFANFENLEVARLAIPALTRLARRHMLLVVLFENDAVEEVARAPYRQGAKASNKASEMRFRNFCAHYIEQQQLLAAFLRRNHINVAFTSPANLTSTVIASYLDFKSRALL